MTIPSFHPVNIRGTDDEEGVVDPALKVLDCMPIVHLWWHHVALMDVVRLEEITPADVHGNDGTVGRYVGREEATSSREVLGTRREQLT